jgi:Na+-transporting NADH:ubiquinone oxidoreductase subunit C
MVENDQGIETMILPIHGYGLWSTLYGFIALEGDLKTVVGLGFYQHAETPGLGGEVDNPNWRQQWTGKVVYDEDGEVAVQVLKGSVDSSNPNAEHQVDGLAGATLTSRGVEALVRFWLGENGFGPFLENINEGEA